MGSRARHLRCALLRWPAGHRWGEVKRRGDARYAFARCRRCDKEKLVRRSGGTGPIGGDFMAGAGGDGGGF